MSDLTETRSGPVASVVVPAHDEAEVVARTLTALAAQERVDEVEVVVVANGCTDETAEIARSFFDRIPGLQVEEIATASKIAALNHGDGRCTAFPRIYLDADISLGSGSLAAMIDDLSSDAPRVAAPEPVFDTAGASWPVRAFYDAFVDTPYAAEGLVGLGVYGLSESGRARFGEFPDLTADDLFVQRSFAPSERIRTAGTFTVATPRTASDLVRVRTRVARGNTELARSGGAGAATIPTLDAAPSTGSTVRALGRRLGRGPVSVIVYAVVTLVARRRARSRSAESGWLRDTSSRRTRHEVAGGSSPALRVAYLVSQYPAPSHVFIEREVLGLRARGAEVHTFSVRPTQPDALLSDTMRREHGATTALLGDRPKLARSTIGLAVRRPGALASVVRRAAGSGEATLRNRVKQVAYALEAVVLHRELRARGLRHVHVHFANNGADVARLVVHLGRAIDGPVSGWMWTLTVHGPTEFSAVERSDLAAKVEQATAVACISDFTRSQLMRLAAPRDWSKLSLVRMSVDASRFVPPGSGRERQGQALRVLYVGRLVPEKAAPVLVDAVASLVDADVDVRARLVGSGELEAELARQVSSLDLEDHVELLGAVGQDEIVDAYWWADVFCLPSFQEGLPVVLMEAMATGLPVVTTHIAGIPELVADGLSGFVVPAGRADLVADRLRALADDPALRVAMGRAARERVLAEFTVEDASQAQLDFLVEAQRSASAQPR